MGDLPNKYFICLSYEKEPIPWDLQDGEQGHAPAYFREAFLALEKRLGRRGLTFYLTHKLHELPSYGKDVVAVVLGDEWCRVPDYTHRVLVTFKCYGVGPSLGCRPLRAPSRLSFSLSAKFLRTYAHYLPGLFRHVWHRARGRLGDGGPAPSPIYDIPLGYGNQLDLPVIEMTRRPCDLFFAGSVAHGRYPMWTPQHWIESPKSIARRKMLAGLERLHQKHPELRIDLATMSTFAWNALFYGSDESGEILDASRYSQRMMNAKICLVPRGTSPETFRFFEAMRYGCVLITERLPSRWFYDGSPAIQVEDWSELEEVVIPLLRDPEHLQRKQQEALVWWRTRCSEEALGHFMAAKLDALRKRANADSVPVVA